MTDSGQISAYELAKLQDQDFLLTKRVIDEKVTTLMLSAQQQLISHIKKNNITLPAEVSLSPRKVAKGENYQSLPYWVCDFPASMNKQDLWTFRVVVWWGNEISMNLILKGKFKEQCRALPVTSEQSDIFYTTHSDPWKLELNTPDSLRFTLSNTQKMTDHFHKADFFKLSTSLPLEEINKLPLQSVISFDKLLATANYLA
ncbi:MAG: hypothetical protein Roseis2KO_40150 [Roseivirga sp.]